jgi:hypothetical protein
MFSRMVTSKDFDLCVFYDINYYYYLYCKYNYHYY